MCLSAYIIDFGFMTAAKVSNVLESQCNLKLCEVRNSHVPDISPQMSLDVERRSIQIEQRIDLSRRIRAKGN
jgi:hypothetical protein